MIRLPFCRYRRLISPLIDGELDSGTSADLKRHFEDCSSCRSDYDRFLNVAGKVSGIVVLEAPPKKWTRPVEEFRVSRPVRLTIRRLAVAAVLVLVVIGIAVWNFTLRPARPRLIAAVDSSSIELAARDVHLQWTEAAVPFEYSTDDPADLRRWVRGSTGLEPGIGIIRPSEDGNRYQPVGARIVELNGARAVGIGYRIDSRPVTLIIARERDLKDAPHAGFFSKNISYHFEAGLKTLTWSQSGEAYALVSDLPHYGQQSCLICHTDENRRRLISGLGL
jgi:anti-sigma factor RsiW